MGAAARAGSASRNERLVGLLLSVPSAWLRGGVVTKSAEHGSARASNETRIPKLAAMSARIGSAEKPTSLVDDAVGCADGHAHGLRRGLCPHSHERGRDIEASAPCALVSDGWL